MICWREAMRAQIPGPINVEYENLFWKLKDVTTVNGRIGEHASAIFYVLQKHRRKDEEFALPPLDLLENLAGDNVNREIHKVTNMTDRLKEQRPHMEAEIRQMITMLHEMSRTAITEQKPEFAELAKHLEQFLEREIHILYPASILVGEFYRLKMDQKGLQAARGV